ncbi:MAG: hypothetical protein HUU22_00755 [Phycisphaerae bacterium]|nr:hypothetical protein [Phycisphaerae bacterium]NUQ44544.1 hypothetical protein [Phycisphaerae bacterium]
MIRHVGLTMIVAALMSDASAVSARGDAFDDAAAKLDAAYAKLKSYTARTTTAVEQTAMPGMRFESRITSTVEFLRKDGKALYRAETSEQMTQAMEGKEEKSEARTLVISDGSFMYALREELAGPRKGEKSCTKARAMEDVGGFRQHREYGVVKLLPDEKVDGADCFVLEVRMKETPGAPSDESRTVAHYRKDCGVMVRSVTYLGDKALSRSEVSDVKVNTDVAADRFKFTPPAGVTVVDLTQLEEAVHGKSEKKADPSEEKAADKPAEEKPKSDKPKEEPKLPKLPKLPRLP